jgi:cohesin complex subunit SCC1
MFYSQVILARKGPLGKIWLAAHFDKKLTKNQIFSTDISESVDSVLNPAAPLALRVSGHLMLGIVRIYSRKVKYLMSDCTEAMWKIKLAFRPGNVDLLADAQAGATVSIDDPRFYGNVQPDEDFPELADIAFSQNMLTHYGNLRAAKGRTLTNQRDTIQSDEFDMSQDVDLSMQRISDIGLYSSPLISRRRDEDEYIDMNGEQSYRSRSVSSSKASRVSDIEVMRGEISRSSISNHSVGRTSLISVADSGIGGMSMGFEDEIPAFADQNEVFFGDDQVPQIDDVEPYVEEPEPFQPDDEKGNLSLLEEEQSIEEQRTQYEEDRLRILSGRPTRAIATRINPELEIKSKRKKQVKKAKKTHVVVDERIELSGKVIKQRMNDVSSIMVRYPGDPLPPLPTEYDLLTAEQRLARPSSMSNMCRELLAVFGTVMTDNPLPFPLKEPVTDVEQQMEEQVSFEEPISSPIEMMREAASGERHIGRPSLLGESPLLATKVSEIIQEEVQPEFGDYDQEFQPFEPEVVDTSVELSVLGTRMSEAVGVEGGMEELLEEEGTGSPVIKPKLPENWNARTRAVLEVLQDQLSEKDELTFNDISVGISRRTAAASFLEILQLKTWGLIDTRQDEPFTDIFITQTPETFAILQQ